MGQPTKQSRRNKEPTYIPAEFAAASPEPCIINTKDPNDSDSNRIIKKEEKTVHFLTTHFKNLNVHAKRLLATLIWRNCWNSEFVEISRVPQTDPWFGKKKYRIRFSGYHGMRSIPILLITFEDESNPYTITTIPHDTCPDCGSMNSRFKIRPESTILRCAGCIALPGVKRGL